MGEKTAREVIDGIPSAGYVVSGDDIITALDAAGFVIVSKEMLREVRPLVEQSFAEHGVPEDDELLRKIDAMIAAASTPTGEKG